MRLDLVPADAGRVQEVLDVVVEALGLVAHDACERAQPIVLSDRGRAAQNRCGAEDRGQRRAQLVRHRADQRLAQELGLRAHLGLVERARHIEPLERGSGVGQRVVDAPANLVDGRHAAEVDRDHTEGWRAR